MTSKSVEVILMKEVVKNLFELQSLEFEETYHHHLEKRIAELRAKIPAPILAHYDRLCDQGKKGVALLRNQTCSGCHMRVPLAMVLDVRHGNDVRLCDNCQRYLYLPEETPVAPRKEEHKVLGRPRPRSCRKAPLSAKEGRLLPLPGHLTRRKMVGC